LNPAWRAIAGIVLIGSIVSLAAPPPPVLVTLTYGSVQGDSRNNHPIGENNNRLSYRFRATTTSAVDSIRVQQRGQGGGNNYSGGNGGTIRISIQTDGSGKPSGTILSSLTFDPGNPGGNWETWTRLVFPTSASLTAGRIYHVVFDNVGSAPNTNWISLNVLYHWGALGPRQPTISDDFAVLYATPSTWVVQSGETPIFDLAYANGTHDGMGYIGVLISNYGVISGESSLVRQHFTVSGGSRTISSANVKVRRTSGTSPLTIRLEKGDGTLIEEVSVPAASIPVSAPGNDDGGAAWARAKFATPHVLTNGQSYNLRLSTAADTQYTATPVQEGTDKGLVSYRFTDGDGQATTNGGSRWTNLYRWGYVDLQFYFSK
jgi:hypothetical protein